MRRRRLPVIEPKEKPTEPRYQVYKMPAVGGVRRTRVFGLQKGTDGARVLRSGRKVWTDDKVKNRRTDDDELLKNSVKNSPSSVSFEHEKENGWSNSVPLKHDPFFARSLKEANNGREVRRHFSVVYIRKRKRDNLQTERTDCLSYNNSLKKSKPSEVDRYISIVSDDLSAVIGLESLLFPIFVYMKREAIKLPPLFTFLHSEPQCSNYRCKGIRFLWDYPVNKPGFCNLFGSTEDTPLLAFDFSFIPSFFTSIHFDLLFQPKVLVLRTSNHEKVFPDTESQKVKVPHPSIRASKLYGRSTQLRIGRKRRSSLKQRRRRNNSSPLQNSKNSSNYMNTRSRSAGRKALPAKAKPPIESSTCITNLLVTDSMSCHRIPGATVSIELSNTGEWILVAKKDGKVLYTNVPHRTMKPCSINRVTHDVIWANDETCKLEFPNRQQWSTFKQLFKDCGDHNATSPATPRFIPTPKVKEVEDYFQEGGVFERPVGYISFRSEEVERALAKNAVYEMDSEDETWLSNNKEGFSEQVFEGMIDAFEKAAYCNEEKLNDESDAVGLCGQMAEKEAVEGVYRYWASKRKQRKSALLRVFQEHNAKKAPLIPKPTLRKRRSSFKRKPSAVGRGNHSDLLQAIAAERDAAEERDAFVKVEAAKESAKKVVDYAVSKRQEAQLLMETADLAVYRAVMTLKIAEAARCSDVGFPTDDT